jgi:hypothetical protein
MDPQHFEDIYNNLFVQVVYVLRHKVPEGEGRVRLSGYGVELQIKSTEYKVRGAYCTCQEDYFSCFFDNIIKCQLQSALRTRDVTPGSEFFPSRIQGQKDSRIRIRIHIKELKYF